MTAATVADVYNIMNGWEENRRRKGEFSLIIIILEY